MQMTNAQLIEQLQKLPQDAIVNVDHAEEFAEVQRVTFTMDAPYPQGAIVLEA